MASLATGRTIAGRHSSGELIAFADEPLQFCFTLILFSAMAALLAFVAIADVRQNRRIEQALDARARLAPEPRTGPVSATDNEPNDSLR